MDGMKIEKAISYKLLSKELHFFASHINNSDGHYLSNFAIWML